MEFDILDSCTVGEFREGQRLDPRECLNLLVRNKVQLWIYLCSPHPHESNKHCRITPDQLRRCLIERINFVQVEGKLKNEAGVIWDYSNEIFSRLRCCVDELILLHKDKLRLEGVLRPVTVSEEEKQESSWSSVHNLYLKAAPHIIDSAKSGNAVLREADGKHGRINVSVIADTIAADPIRYIGKTVTKRTIQNCLSEAIKTPSPGLLHPPKRAK